MRTFSSLLEILKICIKYFKLIFELPPLFFFLNFSPVEKSRKMKPCFQTRIHSKSRWIFFFKPDSDLSEHGRKKILLMAFFSAREFRMAEISQEQLASSDFHLSAGLGPKQSLIFLFLLELVDNHNVIFLQ